MRIAAKIVGPTAMLWRVEASRCTRGRRDERDRHNRIVPSFKLGRRESWEVEAGREIGSIQSSQG
jgi:hypothetical protein